MLYGGRTGGLGIDASKKSVITLAFYCNRPFSFLPRGGIGRENGGNKNDYSIVEEEGNPCSQKKKRKGKKSAKMALRFLVIAGMAFNRNSILNYKRLIYGINYQIKKLFFPIYKRQRSWPSSSRRRIPGPSAAGSSVSFSFLESRKCVKKKLSTFNLAKTLSLMEMGEGDYEMRK